MSRRSQPPAADLHTHSTASDGQLAPAELVRKAAQQGLSVLALTDHDTTSGLAEASAAAVAREIRFVGGVEISTDVSRGELHILGYGVRPEHADLQRELETFRANSIDRLRQILHRLRELGIDLPDTSIAPRDGESSAGRPHIARAMIAVGVVSTVTEAFDRYLGSGRPAYVAKVKMCPADAIRLIRSAGGLPVVAHPLSFPDLDQHLERFIESGLAGLEAYYGEYDLTQRSALAALADRYELLTTGGSDYHGDGFREGRVLGSVVIPEAALDRFLDVLAAR